MRRREFLPTLAAPFVLSASAEAANLKGRIKQGVTKGVFGPAKLTVEEMCRESAKLGITGFDFAAPEDWPMLKKYGITPTMYPAQAGGSIPDALNRVENHDRIEATLRKAIDDSAAAGCPNVITFSGNRRGQDDREGADNTVTFLNKLKSHAEDKGVTVTIEVLNSKVNHKDYQFDNIEWGVDVIKRVNSPRVKILFDIYHVQIMQGDIVRRIRDNFQYIAHFHTGGNPGRNDIDGTQELNYGYVMRQIADLGFKGYVTHEYTPAKDHDPLKTLESAVQICDV
jgi:hydroxypyruvate isomerase